MMLFCYKLFHQLCLLIILKKDDGRKYYFDPHVHLLECNRTLFTKFSVKKPTPSEISDKTQNPSFGFCRLFLGAGFFSHHFINRVTRFFKGLISTDDLLHTSDTSYLVNKGFMSLYSVNRYCFFIYHRTLAVICLELEHCCYT